MNEQCLSAHCGIDTGSTITRISQCLKRLGITIFHWVLQRKQRRANRKTVECLATLDEATLKDIGLSRDDITWAGSLPDSVNAIVELEIIARRRPPSR